MLLRKTAQQFRNREESFPLILFGWRHLTQQEVDSLNAFDKSILIWLKEWDKTRGSHTFKAHSPHLFFFFPYHNEQYERDRLANCFLDLTHWSALHGVPLLPENLSILGLPSLNKVEREQVVKDLNNWYKNATHSTLVLYCS